MRPGALQGRPWELLVAAQSHGHQGLLFAWTARTSRRRAPQPPIAVWPPPVPVAPFGCGPVAISLIWVAGRHGRPPYKRAVPDAASGRRARSRGAGPPRRGPGYGAPRCAVHMHGARLPNQPPETDAVHIQGCHQLPEGRRSQASGHARRQGRGAAVAGLARPTLHLPPPRNHQGAGTGAVAAPGTGSALGAGRRGLGQCPLARGGDGRWDVIRDEGASLVVVTTPLQGPLVACVTATHINKIETVPRPKDRLETSSESSMDKRGFRQRRSRLVEEHKVMHQRRGCATFTQAQWYFTVSRWGPM